MLKITPEIRARIARLRAVGYNQIEIAEKLKLGSQSIVSYHVHKMKDMAKTIGDDKAFIQILAGDPDDASGIGLGVLLSKLLKDKKIGD